MVLSGRRFAVAALLASTVIPSFAQAQEAPAPDDSGDIIVTAQKRAQSLQDVPISIQALDTKRLDDLNISNFGEYTKLLPSVSFQTLQPGNTTVYMRGVASGGDGNHSGSLPSVGTYLDEQPVTTIGGTLDVHIYDVARIESLSGPQGTLYGASSEAGTIRIITNKPDLSAFYGRIDGEFNTVNKGGQGGKVEGMVNLPINSFMALRVVGFYQRDAGYIDNVAGCRSFLPEPTAYACTATNGGIAINNDALVKKDFNDVETYGGRAALKIDLDDNWTATPTVLYQQSQSHGVFGMDPRVGDLQVQHFLPDDRRDRYIQAALTIEGKLGNWDVTYAGAYMDRTTLSHNDYTDYAEAYDNLYASVGGLAGYFYFTNSSGNTIAPLQFVIGSDHFKKTSQELRVASPASDRFRVVAGLFYQRQSNLIHQDYYVDGLAPEMSVNGFPGTLWLTQQHRVDKDYAMFGEASFDITPTLTATAGARAFIYDNSLIGFFGFGRDPNGPPYNGAGSSRTGVAGCFNSDGSTVRDSGFLNLLPPAVGGSPCVNLGTYRDGTVVPKNTQGQGVTYRFNLTWKPIDKVLLYGTVSRGYRPGGINRRGTIAPYAADYLINYEFGWKTTLLNGKLRFNGAIYQQDWQHFQFSFLGQNSFTEIHNGPNARIRGIEADATLNLGGLTLTSSAAYTDAKTTQNLCEADDPTYQCAAPNAVASPPGTRLPITPRFKINGTARYSFPIGTAKGFVQGVIAHQSSATSEIRAAKAAALGLLAPWTTLDGSVGATWSTFSLELFASNLTDERAQISRYQACGSCDQRPYVVVMTPRTIGIRAGYKF